MNESVNDGGDCRTAPATPGLLSITCINFPGANNPNKKFRKKNFLIIRMTKGNTKPRWLIEISTYTLIDPL